MIYEKGDPGQHFLAKRLDEDEFPHDFKPKTDRITKSGLLEPGFVPLQAADMLAYEIVLGAERGNFDRYPAKQLNVLPGRIGIFEVEDMPDLERRIRTLGQ